MHTQLVIRHVELRRLAAGGEGPAGRLALLGGESWLRGRCCGGVSSSGRRRLEIGNNLPLVITGGYAVQAHQLVDRLSRDIDVTTDSDIPMEDIAATVSFVRRDNGLTVADATRPAQMPIMYIM